jgi:hypothetical protein
VNDRGGVSQALPSGQSGLHRRRRLVGWGVEGGAGPGELLIEFGVDPDRIIVEDKSRNTEENAQCTAAIVRPGPKQRWPDTAVSRRRFSKNALTVWTFSFNPMPSRCSRACRLGARAIATLVGNTNLA